MAFTGNQKPETAPTGVTRRLISTAGEECVSAPTEMKSTPDPVGLLRAGIALREQSKTGALWRCFEAKKEILV